MVDEFSNLLMCFSYLLVPQAGSSNLRDKCFWVVVELTKSQVFSGNGIVNRKTIIGFLDIEIKSPGQLAGAFITINST
jgi:hypothetical protein